MKTTVVPAQVTTVEDKIVGNLNFTQLLLFTTPIFLSGAIFIFIPPFMNFRGYKLTLSGIILIVFMVLAIRMKEKILLEWFIVIGRFNIRPRYYLYQKNDLHLRNEILLNQEVITIKDEHRKLHIPKTLEELALAEVARLENVLSDPRAKFHFKTTRKGGLRVHIQEIK